MRAGQNGGQSNSQGRDVSQCVEIRCTCAVARPQPFLTCGLEAGIVTLTLRLQGVSPLEIETAAVNGKSVVCWNGLILGAARFFLPLFQFLWLQEQTPVLDWRKGQQYFWRVRPLSVVLPSLCMARPASQTGLPAGSVLEAFVPRGLRGIKASPS